MPGDKLFFRGDLKVTIIKANDLPNADGKDLKSKFDKFLKIEKKKDLSDPYVVVSVDDAKILRTRVKKDDLNPVWNDLFELEVNHEGEDLFFWCYDKNMFDNMDVKLGHAKIPLAEIMDKKVITRRILELISPFGKCKPTLEVDIEFTEVAFARSTFEVLHSYFPLRRSGDVVLYQDACCSLPSIKVHGEEYQPRSAWKDIAQSIEQATNFIYMTGWSLSHTTRLERDNEDSECIGEVLKRKAAQGLRVLVLLWDEPFNSEEIGNVGVVGTNDEITRTFFSNTKVQCILASRIKTKRGMMENLVSSTSFSHHQKTIICDASGEVGRLVAYLGGLDVTCGRYDDQTHALFNTLETRHKGDFYQTFPFIQSETHNGPRQPWHDVHARVSGEAARDVMINFTERWSIEAPKERHHHNNDISFHNGANPTVMGGLARKNRLLEMLDSTAKSADAPPSKTLWRTQIFRSISNDAADFNKEKKFGLSSKHGQKYEASIHKAYISAIREADDFIYIENQYFLGSAHSWEFREVKTWMETLFEWSMDSTRPQANHLIPVEVTQQICQKIEHGERLSVYIVIPLFPEGDPHAAHIQEILYWQFKTISMMYKRIAKALKKAGVEDHPCDYLNFFCLGKREKAPEGFTHPPVLHEYAHNMSTQGRAMIYVHSKAMMVDDVYSIVGSANINQRSMDGRRDTEIALGCWEEEDEGRLVDDGHVQALRKGLWTEHLGKYEAVFDDPSSAECVKRVKELALKNWTSYAATECNENTPHLLKYPINISNTGEVTAFTESECFPDTTAKILGTKSTFLPNRLTV